MLVRTNNADRYRLDGDLAVLAGEQILCSEFKYRRGAEIFGEGEETEYVYQIISGAVRTFKLLSDGRRQINSFHLTGDLFGLENGSTYSFTAEAVVETKVRIIRRRSLFETFASRKAGATNFLGLVTRNLKHAEDHMLLLGRKNSAGEGGRISSRNGQAAGPSGRDDPADEPSRRCRLSGIDVGNRVAGALDTSK